MGRGRPPTALGTWGAIRTKQVREGAYRARTRIRDKDGVTREVTATGTTKAAAERALREKLADRATPTRQAITADTTVAKLASLWLKFLRDEGRIEATTINEYERVLSKVVIPELGGLRLREITTSRLDLFLVRLRATSTSRQRKTKVVMGAMLGMAVRHDALALNPVQQTSRIHREKSETRSLTPEDLDTVRTALRAWTAKQRPGPRASSDRAERGGGRGLAQRRLRTGKRAANVARRTSRLVAGKRLRRCRGRRHHAAGLDRSSRVVPDAGDRGTQGRVRRRAGNDPGSARAAGRGDPRRRGAVRAPRPWAAASPAAPGLTPRAGRPRNAQSQRMSCADGPTGVLTDR